MTTALKFHRNEVALDDDRVDHPWRIAAPADTAAKSSADPGLLWPNGEPLSAPFDAGLGGETFVCRSADQQTTYIASHQSPWLVGLRPDRVAGRLSEFSRMNLGFCRGGISSVAAGGAWVFATGAADRRLLVLRLSYDWYQNHPRLFVTGAVDGKGQPESVAASREGRMACVLYRDEAVVRVYQRRASGCLDLVGQAPVQPSATRVEMESSDRSLKVFHGDLGFSHLELESIFEKLAEIATVRA